MAGVVEIAATGNEVQGRVPASAVNGFRRKIGFGVLATPVTRKTAVIPSASVTLMWFPGRSAPSRKQAGPWYVSRCPSMTDVPRWPGVAEYLYHAASSAAEVRGGAWIVPSWLRPRLSRLELTPIAGMSTDTGSERSSAGPGPPPVVRGHRLRRVHLRGDRDTDRDDPGQKKRRRRRIRPAGRATAGAAAARRPMGPI